VAKSADGKATVRVIAGEALGARAVIETRTPIVLQDWTVQPGADVRIAVPAGLQAFVYVFEGSARVASREIDEGQMAVLGPGTSVRLSGANGPGRLLLLAGAPLREPVARYGPFVMNTRSELVQAFDDFQTGKMGEITRTAEVRDH